METIEKSTASGFQDAPSFFGGAVRINGYSIGILRDESRENDDFNMTLTNRCLRPLYSRLVALCNNGRNER